MKIEIKGVHSVAEWMTLVTSTLLILGIAAFLIQDIFETHTKFLEISARPLLAKVQKAGDAYIVPVEIRNGGDRTAKLVRVELAYTDKDGKRETSDLEVDYLARGSEVTVYQYLDVEPSGAQIEVTPGYYKLE